MAILRKLWAGLKWLIWGPAEPTEKEEKPFTEELKKKVPGWIRPNLEGQSDTRAQAGDQWFQTLYKEYTGRIVAYDEIIWKVTAVMVPLSLAPYAILANLGCFDEWRRVLLLAIGSIASLSFWFIVVFKYLRGQQNWLHRLWAIETRLGLYDFARPDEEEEGVEKPRWYQKRHIIKKTFRVLWRVNLLVWLVLLLMSIPSRPRVGGRTTLGRISRGPAPIEQKARPGVGCPTPPPRAALFGDKAISGLRLRDESGKPLIWSRPYSPGTVATDWEKNHSCKIQHSLSGPRC